ncbi:hypothetical protein GCM10027275_50080 [Rhabdobacter roseus]|jgi:hypothetical protein|uniref:Uncharacterized protein n=1 Tax=Rhabdobacter roseus TaxID=1655419 RepID=A0A840TZL7_9BACT|nr:hypothetical protein [Rhabdobacter roseus]MBB5287072.1 hypothetical protein [Rhabdobacter roseus]
MAKNKKPFSSLLDDPEAKKSIQDALQAPAQLPKDVKTETASASTKEKAKPETYQNITIRKSVHRLLKMAATHYELEIRELASEAIANDPRIQEIIALTEKK